MTEFIDFLLHSDKHLLEFVQAHGPWIYAFIFAIVFAETGFVVTPFLPGDSLLLRWHARRDWALNPYTPSRSCSRRPSGNAVNRDRTPRGSTDLPAPPVRMESQSR